LLGYLLGLVTYPAFSHVFGRLHQRLLQARSKGKAVLLISADLEEILSIADRIAVMYEGHIAGTLGPAEATEERLGLMMTGGGK